jgi:hypothetical protein
MAEDVFIAVNRRKLLIQAIFISLLGIVALMAGLGLAETTEFIEPWIWQGIGVLICLLALVGAGSKMRRRSDSSAGLTIGKEGIDDQSSDLSLGIIKWGDIKEIDREQCLKERMFILIVRKENDYKKRAKNSAITRLLEQNIRRYGTPVVIDPSYLEISLEELLDQSIEHFKRRR